jgi:hypothetical protein
LDGCSAAWNQITGALLPIQTIIFDCYTQLFGPFEGLGAPCASNSDCFFGASCVLEYGKCNQTLETLVECWADSIDSEVVTTVAQIMFNYWEVPELAQLDNFVDQLTLRYVKPLCWGPACLQYRPRYDYVLAQSACSDPCTVANITLQCTDPDPINCPVDEICPPIDDTWCPRVFHFVDTYDNVNCVQEYGCNWMPCDTMDPVTCQTTCLADQSPLCMDCTSM